MKSALATPVSFLPPAEVSPADRVNSFRFFPALLLLVLAGSLVAGPVQAQEAGEARAEGASGEEVRWTPALGMRYHSIGGTALSPDGRHVAYVESKPLIEGEQSTYRSHIYLVPTSGSAEPLQYTRGEASTGNPRFSPGGDYLAFTSGRGGKSQVWVMRVRGGEAWQLTHAETGVNNFAWSPSGDRIAYLMRNPKSKEQKKHEREKRDVQIVGEGYRYNHLYVLPFSQTEDTSQTAQRLTSGDFYVRRFDWSPDGRQIVFSHIPNARTNSIHTEGDLSTVPADSGAVRALVSWKGTDRDPHFSPDGQWVAFTSSGKTTEIVGIRDVYRVPAAGGDPQKLSDTPDRFVVSVLGWSADGQDVFVTETKGTSRHVFAVPAGREGSPRQVTEGKGVFGGVAFDEACEKMAFTFQDSDTPANVYVSPVGRFDREQITRIHEGVPRPPMGRTELVRWTSPDGTEVEGLLTYPVGYREDRTYPLILDVHGGPAGVHTRRFTGAPDVYMLQYFAQNGYAVLRPNPRGSIGYGKEFRYANVEDWGYGDFEDLMAGVDQAIERGVTHPDSLALMGWSYGGYMTAFAVTRTDRFEAASMGAGISNLVSMVGTTDIPSYIAVHMGGEVWNNEETYEKHSAIYHVDEVSTPTQIIHGAEDIRVPTTQGREFYRALKRLGVPTEMIIYPRTSHGLSAPKFVMDASHRIMDWFEQYVRGNGEDDGSTASAARTTSQ